MPRRRRNSSSSLSSSSSFVSTTASPLHPSGSQPRSRSQSPPPPPPSHRPASKRLRPTPSTLQITESDLESEPRSDSDDAAAGAGAGGGSGSGLVHPIYGQRMAFPGLGGWDDDYEEKTGEEDGKKGEWESAFTAARSGIGYLKLVRSEANRVPHVLVRPKESEGLGTTENGLPEDDENGGYFDDGAFIAAPDPDSRQGASRDATTHAQEAYYVALKDRFKSLKDMLHRTPPLSAVEALTPDHPITLPPDSSNARQQWRFLLQSQQPSMTQLACMDMETILGAVKLLKDSLASTVRSRSKERVERLGAWMWSILGRCDEAGQLDSGEVSELRELGKRAVGLLVGIQDRTGKAYSLEEENEELGGEGDYDVQDLGQSMQGGGHSRPEPAAQTTNKPETIPQAESARDVLDSGASKPLLPNGVCPLGLRGNDSAEEGEIGEVSGHDDIQVMKSIDQQTRMMLDMIITVVGDLYGQRDLLQFRDTWHDEQPRFSA